MNKRTFLLGVGTGMIVGAALLQLFLIGQGQGGALTSPLNEETTYTQAELDQRIAEEKAKLEAELTAGQNTGAASGNTTGTNTGTNTSSNTNTTKQPPAAQAETTTKQPAAKNELVGIGDNGRLIVRILPGKGIQDVADLLYDNKIITDKKTFISMMRGKTVRAGYFAFAGKLTLRQVRTVLTNAPLSQKQALAEIAANSANSSK